MQILGLGATLLENANEPIGTTWKNSVCVECEERGWNEG